jgi:hypothetical protein
MEPSEDQGTWQIGEKGNAWLKDNPTPPNLIVFLTMTTISTATFDPPGPFLRGGEFATLAAASAQRGQRTSLKLFRRIRGYHSHG